MSEFPNLQPEELKKLDEILEPYFAHYHKQKCYLGLVFQQGKRQMIQINVPAEELPTLLQAKPSTNNDPNSGKNRPEIKGHADEIKKYILKRTQKNKPWILGTLTANIDPSKIDFFELGRGLCFLVLRRGVKLDITDGQHRKRAIHELIESSNGELIGEDYFPITLVLEGDLNQCQTDFRDMAQTRKLDKSLLVSFGQFEGRVGITKKLLEVVPMFIDKTEKIKGSPDAKKKLIFTTNFIAKMVSCSFASRPNDELQDYDVDASVEILANCLNQFFSECNQTKLIAEVNTNDLTIQDLEDFQENCVLGTSAGMEILGRLLHDAYDEANYIFNPGKVLQIAHLDWSRNSHIWEGNIVLYNQNPQGEIKSYKITASANAIKMATNMAKANLGWI